MTVKFYNTDNLKFLVTPACRFRSDSPKSVLHYKVWVLDGEGNKMFCRIKDLIIHVNEKTTVEQYDIQLETNRIKRYISEQYEFNADDYDVEKTDNGLILTPIIPEKTYMCQLWKRTRGNSFFFDDEKDLEKYQKRYNVDICDAFVSYKDDVISKLMVDLFGNPLDELYY